MKTSVEAASKQAFAFGVVVALAALFACNGRPSKGEIDKLVDERLAERGLAPLPSSVAAVLPSASASASAISTSVHGDPAAESLAFLAKLDDLMADYKPVLPVVEDKTDLLRCVTSAAAKNSPDVKRVAPALRNQKEAADRERESKERAFYASVSYALAFHYDLDWATRRSGPATPPKYGCWERTDGFLSNIGDANYCTSLGLSWRLQDPGHGPGTFVYSNSATQPTQPPELMRHIDAASVKPPTRFSCRVEDELAEPDRPDRRTVKCRSPGTGASLRLAGRAMSINVGDVVSVPFAQTKRDPDGVLFKNVAVKDGGWIVDGDGSSLTIDSAATCPSMSEILSVLGDAGVRSTPRTTSVEALPRAR